MPERVLEALKASAAVIGAITALTLWGARLEFQVAQKATREEVRMVQDSLTAEQRKVQVEVRDLSATAERTEQMVQRLVCRSLPNDLSCR
jgi:hypothetical protein